MDGLTEQSISSARDAYQVCVCVCVCVVCTDVGKDSPALFACKALSMEVSLFGTVDVLPTVSHSVLINCLVVYYHQLATDLSCP